MSPAVTIPQLTGVMTTKCPGCATVGWLNDWCLVIIIPYYYTSLSFSSQLSNVPKLTWKRSRPTTQTWNCRSQSSPSHSAPHTGFVFLSAVLVNNVYNYKIQLQNIRQRFPPVRRILPIFQWGSLSCKQDLELSGTRVSLWDIILDIIMFCTASGTYWPFDHCRV